jgi:TPR repeat protein
LARYRLLADQADPAILFEFANCLFESEDFPQAAFYYKKASEGGFTQALLRYADCARDGIGIDADPEVAAAWYLRAAHENDPNGQYESSLCFRNGIGLERNVQSADVYLRRAADQKHVRACIDCASQLKATDPNRALHYLTIAVPSTPKERYDIAMLLMDLNEDKAVELLKQSADEGLPDAEVAYADWLAKNRNPAAAVYYKRLADRDFSVGAFNLGKCYRFGLGVVQNHVTAAHWFKEAMDRGHENAASSYYHCLAISTSPDLLATAIHFEMDMSQFTEVRPLGNGAFGFVKLMRDPKTKLEYAVKEFHMSGGSGDEVALSFAREVHSLVQLRHPCILQIRGFDVLGRDRTRIAIDFMEKGSVEDVLAKLRKGQKAPSFWTHTGIAILIAGFALGMRFMHRMDTIHRDLKPANLLIGGDARLRIGDLGTARINGDGLAKSINVSTPLYRAPEMTTPNYTEKVDVWSFGLILYEILTDGKGLADDQQILQNIKTGGRPSIPSDFDKDMELIVTKCWDSDPNARPSFAEIVDLFTNKAFGVYPDADRDAIAGYIAEIEAEEYRC